MEDNEGYCICKGKWFSGTSLTSSSAFFKTSTLLLNFDLQPEYCKCKLETTLIYILALNMK